MLREGGILIYSTCSLSARQNEQVVRHLLQAHAQARLVGVAADAALKGFAFAKGELVQGQDAGTRLDTTKCIRFAPFTSNTSGLFVAKITKKFDEGCDARDFQACEVSGDKIMHGSCDDQMECNHCGGTGIKMDMPPNKKRRL